MAIVVLKLEDNVIAFMIYACLLYFCSKIYYFGLVFVIGRSLFLWIGNFRLLFQILISTRSSMSSTFSFQIYVWQWFSLLYCDSCWSRLMLRRWWSIFVVLWSTMKWTGDACSVWQLSQWPLVTMLVAMFRVIPRVYIPLFCVLLWVTQ